MIKSIAIITLCASISFVSAYSAEVKTATKYSRQFESFGTVIYTMSYQTNLTAGGGISSLGHRLVLQRENGSEEVLWKHSAKQSNQPSLPNLGEDEYKYSQVIDFSWSTNACAILFSMDMNWRYLKVQKTNNNWVLL